MKKVIYIWGVVMLLLLGGQEANAGWPGGGTWEKQDQPEELLQDGETHVGNPIDSEGQDETE